ncbi:MAG TPA: BON domain-containing protein [Anaerolineae bacterium]
MNEFDFNIGAQVHCQDGKCGKLAKVVVNPETLQVTDLIVEEGFLLKRARVFPISVVETATAEEIHLSINSDELGNFREYREVEYEAPAPGGNASFQEPYAGMPLNVSKVPMVREKVREGISSDELIVVQQGTPVSNAKGKVGKLDHVLSAEDSNEITHLVVRHGALFGELLVIPVSMVEHVGEKGILIAPTDNELKELDRYTAEENVAAQGTDDEEDPFATTILHRDSALSEQVAAALSADPRTSGAIIEVINDQGTITLAGQVDSLHTREAAGEVAAKTPGVTSVINTLEVATLKAPGF